MVSSVDNNSYIVPATPRSIRTAIRKASNAGSFPSVRQMRYRETGTSAADSDGTALFPRAAPRLSHFPRYALSDGTRLFIADGGNDRVLVYNTIPTTNGAAADMILGEAGRIQRQHGPKSRRQRCASRRRPRSPGTGRTCMSPIRTTAAWWFTHPRHEHPARRGPQLRQSADLCPGQRGDPGNDQGQRHRHRSGSTPPPVPARAVTPTPLWPPIPTTSRRAHQRDQFRPGHECNCGRGSDHGTVVLTARRMGRRRKYHTRNRRVRQRADSPRAAART